MKSCEPVSMAFVQDARIGLVVSLLLLFCSSTASSFPANYDDLYLVLASPNDARSMALGNGIIGISDGFHNDAWSNPALASLPRGIYASVNTHTTLIEWDRVQFRSSSFSSGYSLPDNRFDQAKLQKVSLGCAPSGRVGVQFNYVRHLVVDSISLMVATDSFIPGSQTTAIDIYGLAASVRIVGALRTGFSAKYYKAWSEYKFLSHLPDRYGKDGYSYDAGLYLSNVFPGLTARPDLAKGKHFFDRFAGNRSGGISAGLTLKNFGPTTDYYSPKIAVYIRNDSIIAIYQYKGELPATLHLSVSCLVVEGSELTLELFAGWSQNFQGAYEEDFWDLKSSDGAIAGELTLCNLLRARLSYYRLDLNRSNAWGVSIGPPWCQLEYGQTRDLGLLTDGNAAPEDMQSILSLTVNVPLP